MWMHCISSLIANGSNEHGIFYEEKTAESKPSMMVWVPIPVWQPTRLLAGEIEWKSGCFDKVAGKPPWGGGWKIEQSGTGGSRAAEPTGTIMFVGGPHSCPGPFLNFRPYDRGICNWPTTTKNYGSNPNDQWAEGITIPECTEEDGQIRYWDYLYVPESDSLCPQTIQEDNDTAVAWHPGWAKTFDLLDQPYCGKVMQKHVGRYVWNCHSCRWLQRSRHLKVAVLWPLPFPNKPWEDISMDCVVELPECEGFNAIRVVVDRISNMGHFIPCHTTINAPGLANLLFETSAMSPRTTIDECFG